jgi:hypothetical protein
MLINDFDPGMSNPAEILTCRQGDQSEVELLGSEFKMPIEMINTHLQSRYKHITLDENLGYARC